MTRKEKSILQTISENTNEFLKLKPVLYYEAIDFLTVRLDICPFLRTLNGLVENSDSFILENGFKIQFFGLVAWSQLKVLHILDEGLNLVAYVHIKQPTNKKNRNFSSDIEFVGLFWKSYSEYLDYFFTLFSIDPHKTQIVSRIDYCFDFLGITVADFTRHTRNTTKKSHNIRYGESPTYTNNKWDRHDLCLYDKKLDILEKNKHKIKVDGKRVYHQYLKETQPITRVEFRKKSRAIKELVDNSINGLFTYIRQQSSDYFGKIYDLDFATILSSCDLPLSRLDRPQRVDILYKGISSAKLRRYLAMAQAYAENYVLLRSERAYFDELLLQYGDRIVNHMLQNHDKFKRNYSADSNTASQIFP